MTNYNNDNSLFSGSLLDVGAGGRRKSSVAGAGMGRRKSSGSRMDPRGRAIRSAVNMAHMVI